MSNRITDVSAVVKAYDVSFGSQMAKTRRDLEQTVGVAESASARMRGVDLFGGLVPTFDVGGALSSMFAAAQAAYQQFQADIQTIDQRAQDAEGLGFTYNELQALTAAATLADVPLERLSGTLGRFLKTVAMAGEGSSEAQKDLARLGLTVKDFEGLTSWQAIKKVADQINEMPTPAERAAASMEIFGREAGLKMVEVLGKGGVALDAYMAKAVELGLTMDEQLIGKAKTASDEFDFFRMQVDARRQRNNTELAGSGVGTSLMYLMNAHKGLDLLRSEAMLFMEDYGRNWGLLIEGGVGALLRARDAGDVSAPTGRTSASPSGQPTVPPIVAVEDEAQRIESVYDQIEEEQKKSAERIAAWRDQVRQQELEREYREYGEQIERLEKERMESERRAADEAEKQAREIGRVRMDAERAAANAWDSTGGGLGASLLAVMGTAEQQLASYQASRARGNAEMRADYIERAVEAVLRKITVNTNVVRGGVIAAPV